jgi:hypothetical protein
MTSLRRRKLHADPLQLILRKLDIMAEKLDGLQAAETGESAAIDAAIADIKALGDKLAAIPTSDPATQAAIDALAADMTAKTKALTDAVSPAAAPTPPASPAA